MDVFMMILLILVAVFMILLVLVQRGRGGGLAGALGGAGGQSAFGAKAGDTFTKITVWAAFIWILLCVVAVKTIGTSADDNPLLDGMNARPGASTAADKPASTDTPSSDTQSSDAPAPAAPAPAGGESTGE